MGQICQQVCAPQSQENEKRITELEKLLKEQELEKAALKKNLEKEKERQKKYKKDKHGGKDEDVSAEKIKTLKNEKKTVFKQMLKERKNVSKLEDSIQDYKSQIAEMEHQINRLKKEKRHAQERADHVEQNENRRKLTAEKLKNAQIGVNFGYSPRHSEIITRSPSPRQPGQQRHSEVLPNTASKKANTFVLGSVLDGINIPRPSLPINVGHGTYSEPYKPGRVKRGHTELSTYMRSKKKYDHQESDYGITTDEDTLGGGTTTEVSSTEDDADGIEQKTTMELDHDFDAPTEVTHVYSWIHDQRVDPKNKQSVKQLKTQLAGVLTARSEGYRQQLVRSYREQYGSRLEKDIKSKIGKGHTLQIVHGLLMTRAQYDATLISECVKDWDIEPVADIICCRSVKQLNELHEAYKKKFKLEVKKQLQALAQKDKKKTLVKVIGKIFDLDRKESKDVDMNKMNEELNFVLTTKNFTGSTKARLVILFTTNSVQFIKILNQQFRLKSKDSLTVFIDKKLGPKSTAGYFCKTRILYALDTSDYYAKMIKKLGGKGNFKKHFKKISDIFIQRMEIDLDLIKRKWDIQKYGDGKSLKEWIHSKSGGSKSGEFLMKMLDNCDRYGQFRDDGKKKSKWEDVL